MKKQKASALMPKEMVRGPDGKMVEAREPKREETREKSKAAEVWEALTRPTYRDPKEQAAAMRRRGMEK